MYKYKKIEKKGLTNKNKNGILTKLSDRDAVPTAKTVERMEKGMHSKTKAVASLLVILI